MVNTNCAAQHYHVDKL